MELTTTPRLRLNTARKIAIYIRLGNSGTSYQTAPNTFSLPPVTACPYATPSCKKACYALDHQFPAVKAIWNGNLQLLDTVYRDDGEEGVVELLCGVVAESQAQHRRLGVPLSDFRLHEAGDFHAAWYARAWAEACRRIPEVQFWAYTRSFPFVGELLDVPNLTVYLSADCDNWQAAHETFERYRHRGLMVAVMAYDEAEGDDLMTRIVGRRAPICPVENPRRPMPIARKVAPQVGVGACIECRMCIKGVNHVIFLTSV